MITGAPDVTLGCLVAARYLPRTVILLLHLAGKDSRTA